MIKSSAIFFIAGWLLLASIPAPVSAQEETSTVTPAVASVTVVSSNVSSEAAVKAEPQKEQTAAAAPVSPAPKEQAEPSAQTTTTEAVSSAPAAEKTSEAAPATTGEKPPAVPAAPAVETSKAAETAAPAVSETPAASATATVPATTESKAVETNSESKPETQAPAAEKPAAAAVEKTAEPSTEQPAAVSVEKPAAPVTATPTIPSAEQPAAAPAEKPETTAAEKPAAPASPAVAEPVTEKGIEFELDRGSVKAAPGGQTPEVKKAEAQPQPKSSSSLWQRLFGDKKGAPPAPEKAAAAGVKTATPSAAPADMTATNKALTQEELVAAQEEVRRQAKEVEALKDLDMAYQAMGRNEFDVALKYFAQAMNVMPIRPHTIETRQKAMQSQAECEYRIALNYYRDGKIQETKDAIRLALGFYPAHQKAARLSEQIKKDETQRAAREAIPVPPRHTAEHLDREKQIRESINRGRQYYAIGEYEKARREFMNVMYIDEKNEEAAAHLKKLAEKMYDLETDQMDRMQAEMMTQVRDTWTPPVKREAMGPETKVVEATITDKGKRRLMEKLNTIVIPQLEFRMANIVDVIKYLDETSIACDKESATGEKGVNFILQLKRPGEAAEAPPARPAKPAEGELTGEEGTTAATTPANVPAVTLSLRNIVLMDAIKYITEVTGLRYRIEENVVVITPSDVAVGELLTRTYKVQPSIAETIMGTSEAGKSEGGKTELGAGAVTATRGDVKKFFVDAGVPFPEGTSIAYKPSLNLLIVKNTAENLESFERILTSLNVVPVQVEIEARFVEVSQQDLDELGVEWNLMNNWVLAQNPNPNAPLSAQEQIQMNQNNLTKGLRNLVQGSSGISAQPGGNLAGIFSFSSILTNPEMTMIIHALEQRSGANLLSAPKVTTKSGANAEIKVVEELIYPSEFTLSQSTVSGSGSGSQAVVTPAFVTPSAFQTRDTGVILNVTPTVGPDGFSIDLVMLPQVVELQGWEQYGSTVTDATGHPQVLNMPQPIFHSRTITTSITIWDGQTVVMGGLITEQQTTTYDKIPFLGDIPLVGYLFQSKTSNSQKFNLLIFVTANLVDPAGNKINKEPVATSAGTGGAAATVPKASL